MYINMYSDELDDLYVVNGRKVSPAQIGIIQDDDISSSTKNQSNGTIKLRPEPRDAKESKKKTKPDEGTYEEHYETYEEYCIHRQQLVNQGITMCDINQDVTMCGSCPYRKSRTTKVKVSSASTASTKKSKK